MPRYSSAAWRAYRPDGQLASAAPVSTYAPVAADCLILGLDPGSRRTGYGLLQWRAGQPVHVAHGCIDVLGGARGGGLASRLRFIYEAVHELVATHHPTEIAIERVFLHKNADSALKLGQARGVALCAATALGAAAHEYAPRAIKQAVTGHGGAEKGQVGHMIALLLQLDSPPQVDAADALAIALCHAQSRRLAAVLGRGA